MKRVAFVLTLLVALTVVLSPFTRELFVGDETKYSRIIYEMRESGELLVPTLNGRPYTHKPPIHFWVITALTSLFGFQSLWPFVFQSVAGFLVLLFLIHRFAGEIFDHSTARVAPLFFATSYLAWGIAQTARMDITFTLFVTLALMSVFRFLRDGISRHLLLAALFVAIAILIKGPMALVVVLMVLLIERIRGVRLPRTKAYWGAFALVASIPMLWLIPAVIRGGNEYADELLVKQNVGRAVNSWVHKEPIWYYLVQSPASFFPLFFIAIFGIVAMYRRHWRESDRTALRFCWSWVLAVLVSFSLLSGKLHVYMLPAIFPLALIAARFVTAISADDKLGRRMIVTVRTVAMLLWVVFAAAPFFLDTALAKNKDADVISAAPVAAMMWLAAAVLGLGIVFMFHRDPEPVVSNAVLFSAASLAPLVVLGMTLMPLANELSSTRPLVRHLAEVGVPAGEIALYYSPHLWTRKMPRELFGVRYIDADGLDPKYGKRPTIVVTRDSRAKDLGPALAEYVKIGSVRMIGKPFDVYRRR